MALAFAGAHAWRPTQHMADMRQKVDLETMFPKAFGDWTVDDRMPVQLISPDQAAVLNKIYNQTLSRTYVNRAGERIMLSVAYGGDQSDGTRAHRPEVCYPAQGFQIVSSQATRIPLGQGTLPVRQLLARQGGRIEPITYWVMVGDRVALSGTQQKLAQLSFSVRGIIPDGLLIRVSSIDANAAKAYGDQAVFVDGLARALRPADRSLVVGTGG
ncbi:MAG: EpsI family protein [Rubrivivax sp.]|nr:EpsI family protein [Rubrivivax sp.]